jgi:hypothetical protein
MKKEITKEEALEWIAQMHASKEFCREDIKEDVINYMTPLLGREYEFTKDNVDDLCEIVERNFKTMEDA